MIDHVVVLPESNTVKSHEEKIYAEQVRLTYKPIKLSIIGTFAGAALFVAVQWNVVSHNILLLWLLVMTSLISLHGYLAYRYFLAKPSDSEAKIWGRYYVLSTSLAGLLWGAGSILFFPESHFENQITVAFAMVIISAGGVITISHLRAAAYALIIPCMLPLIPLFLLEDSYLSTILALISLVLFIFMMMSIYYFHASSHENIGLRLIAVENERALLLAKEEIEKASQAKSDFISSMSHELRTPMNVILGYAQLLEYDKSASQDAHSNVQEIIKAGYHLLDLINEVLNLSQIESGEIKLNSEYFNLVDCVDVCFKLISPVAQKQGIFIEPYEIDDVSVYADKKRVKQVLLNLLSNAVKYNKQSGKIGVEVNPINGNYIRITVIDTGEGIPKEKLIELFLPFNRLNAANKGIEGTGIGLTISRNLVEIMGGRIGVESEPDVGSRFWFDLPLKELIVLPERE